MSSAPRHPAPRPLGPSAPRPITDAQRRALFAAARQRGLSIEDLRTMTPQHSIRLLDTNAAAQLLERLNEGGERSSASPHRPRRPSNVIALISADQQELIRKLRIAMGWNRHQLGDHMKARHYPSDPSRTMDEMHTSRDAQAVIEHLKKILARTLETSSGVSPAPSRRLHAIPRLMQSTPPHPRLLQLLQLRRDDLAALTGNHTTVLTVDLSCCASVAHTIYELETEIVKLKSSEARSHEGAEARSHKCGTGKLPVSAAPVPHSALRIPHSRKEPAK